MANFDIASFNLINWANATPDLYDSAPKNVEIVQKDANGNLFTKSIANRGMFKQQLWDDVGGAVGQFNRTFYVDAVNGDDNNTGTSNSPLKTLDRAVQLTPVMGRVSINLLNDYTITTRDLYWGNKDINLNLNNYTITVQAYLNSNGVNEFPRIHNNKNITVINGSLTYVLADSSANVTTYGGRLALFQGRSVLISNVTVNIQNGGTLINTGELMLSNVTINTNSKGYAIAGDGQYNANQKIFLTQYNCTIDDSNYWIRTMVKDANGVPRNVVSNIVF